MKRPVTSEASDWIRRLGLSPHPEGGFFAETYRSQEHVPARALPSRYGGSRCLSTAIYFLVAGGDFSAFHRLKSDEIWHFYAGEGLALHVLDAAGRLTTSLLGRSPSVGQAPQAVVPWGTWLAAKPLDQRSYGLVGCTVAPGFGFADFELGQRDELVRLFPIHRDLIISLTREPRPAAEVDQ